MPHLEQTGDVFVLDLGDGENRINPAWSAEVVSLLDEVIAAPAPKALVTTATGKFFSNGLDTAWGEANGAAFAEVRASANPVLLRVLTMPAITVAAIQGHAFAAGALLSLAHDFRFMREDRGYWCLPEIDLRLVYPPSSVRLAEAKLSAPVLRDAMLTGRRYGGLEAVHDRIVDAAIPADSLRNHAVTHAQGLVEKADPAMGAIKRRLYADVVACLEDGGAG